jgi:hypothetical protein
MFKRLHLHKNQNFFHHHYGRESNICLLNYACVWDLPKLPRLAKSALTYLSTQYVQKKSIHPFQNVRTTSYRKDKSVVDAASSGNSCN